MVPDLFTDEEIEALEYPVTSWMRSRRQYLKEIHDLMSDGSNFQEALGEEGAKWENFLWAVTVVNSRTHAVRMGEGEMLRTVVPIVDLCNHDQDPNLSLNYNVEEGAFELRSRTQLQAGAHLTIKYGDRTGETWLQQYGFIPYPNPTDTILLDFSSEMSNLREMVKASDGSEVERLRYSLLHRSGMVKQTRDEVVRASHRSMMEPEDYVATDHTLMRFMRVMSMSLEELKDPATILRVMSNDSLKGKSEKASVTLSLEKLREASLKFSTSLEADESALLSAETEATALILHFRISKKRTLQRVTKLMETVAEKMKPKRSAFAQAKEQYGAEWEAMSTEDKKAAIAACTPAAK